jgi:hypothetical protein
MEYPWSSNFFKSKISAQHESENPDFFASLDVSLRTPQTIALRRGKFFSQKGGKRAESNLC